MTKLWVYNVLVGANTGYWVYNVGNVQSLYKFPWVIAASPYTSEYSCNK